MQDLKKAMEQQGQDLILIDVRNPTEYKTSSINGSELIPLSSIENGEAIDRIRNLIEGRQLYIHCQRGNRSAKALSILHQYGIKGINVTGGIDAWCEES